MEKPLKISVCCIVKNAEETLQECLESLKEFEEIILLDNGSTDNTLKIAENFKAAFPDLKIFSSEFIGFGALKNLAISYARNDWIFSIDSDEVLEAETLEELKEIFNPSKTLNPNSIFSLPRKNLYKKRWIKACGWYPDFVYRIFNKTHTQFNTNIVHESLVVKNDSVIFRLQNGLKHYAYNGITMLLEKLNRYSSLWAMQNQNKSASLWKAILRGNFHFLRDYFFKKGFFYGADGFVISLCNGLGAFFKYAKLYEMQDKTPTSCSLVVSTYNQKERLSLVLESIRELKILPTEVIIADDGSKEDTKELIESYRKDFPCPLRHIWQEDLGFRLSAVRNKAIHSALGEYIIAIDGDMILDSYFIQDHLHFAQKGVYLQGSRVILNAKDTQEILQEAEKKKVKEGIRLLKALKLGIKSKRILPLSSLIFLSKINADFFKHHDFIKGIRGCNMGFYKQDFLEIGGFNENFIGWGREDSEFVARFLFKGGEMRRLKFSAIAYHLFHEENSRKMLEANHQIYLDTIREKKTHWKSA